MRLSRIQLTDFRSYSDLRIDLPPGMTTLLGANGAGKTNIVEAIRYLGTLSSHRVSTDASLVRAGESRGSVMGIVEKAGRSLAIEITIVIGGSNSARLNRAPVRPREIAGILRTVVFSPEDIDLVKGEPGGRRRFLDDLCVTLSPVLAGDLADYERVVRQRGALLKALRGKGSETSALEIWDEKLATLGARILRARIEAIRALVPYVSAAYADIDHTGTACSLRYGSSVEVEAAFDSGQARGIEEALLEALAREGPRERERGVCLVGPHRDDVVLSIGDLPARGYASHGESWSAALALRLGTYSLLTATGGPDSGKDGEPVLILDDVFAELDGHRRAALAERASTAQQVVVTAAVKADVPAALGGSVFMVDGGKVTIDG
ncbi:MAG: DNA replication/repair protein RecF [Demequinaceae bacterium]|nr:DNA replication/repair protein RecF [Demequinaceae bacterium]